MRSPINRAALVAAGSAAFAVLPASDAAADQSLYCVYAPSVYVGVGPRPMTMQEVLCIPWTT